MAVQDPATIELAARFDLRALDEMLHGLVRQCTPEQFERWRRVSPDEQVACWDAYYRDTVLPTVTREITTSAATRDVLSLLTENVPTNPVMQARRDVLIDKLTSMAAGPPDSRTLSADLDAIHANARVQGGGTANAWASGEVYEKFKNAAGELRDAAAAARLLVTFDPQAARDAATVAGQLFVIADGVRLRYAERKQELNALDFNDLLSRARNLLTDPRYRGARDRLSSQIHLLLVDEFQDTDPLQVELVEALCGGGLAAGKLFFVGDYKQSIYRFRGAKPHVFRELRERTPPAGQQSLTLNFRSQPAILEFVNGLFWDDLGDGYEPLRAHRPQVSPTPAVEFLWAPAAQADAKQNKEGLRRREADWIARRVRALVDGGEPIVLDADAVAGRASAARPARPADIAILFRALSDVELYEEALRRHGIDYYVVGGHAFYAQQEIFDLLNLLRALNSQSDLVSLVGILRSGMFALTDETIFWLSRHNLGLSGGLFADQHPDEISPEQQRRVRFAADTILFLRERKDRMRICELIEAALERTGYDAVLLNEFMGERKLANLRKLVEQARAFQRGDLFDLSDFINQLAEFIVQQPDEPLAATHSENTDVVRLMTIHQSKGLEFPIVIVPDVDRPRHHRGAGVHFDARLGPLVRLPAENAKTKGSVGGYELWRFAEKEEEAAELNRLLYVATTRAADYLILSSGVPEMGAVGGPWTELLARRFELASGRFIGRLPDGEPHPKVKVTTEEPPIDNSRWAPRRRVDMDKIIGEALRGREIPRRAQRAIGAVAPNLGARRQYSFSRLAGTLHQDSPAIEMNSDSQSQIDPRGLGTLVHSVLAMMDFEGAVDCKHLVRLHAKRHLSDDAPEIGEAQEMIERFAASSRARELAAAREGHAEVEFLLGWPLEEGQPHETLIAGFIDRLCQDARGNWHVLDFKTNRVPTSGVADVAALYEMQMLVYGLATERILGAAPASLTLHFLRTGAEHSFAWDDAARARAIRLVSDGIAAAATSPARVV